MPFKGGIIVQPQKGKLCIPEYREHFLNIWCESLDNYYLLAFTEILKNLEIWKKSGLGSKINLNFFFFL